MKELLNLLKEKHLTLGSIESMTGGVFASTVTDVPGASQVFKGSVVTYTAEAKENVVGVSPETIKKYSVVSSEVAEEMARKGQKLLNVDVCISVTGNAGPTCEPGEEPVGSVFLGLMVKDEYFGKHLRLQGNRSMIRYNTYFAMRDFIMEHISDKK